VTEPDLGAILSQAKEFQERLAKLQQDLAKRTVEGSAGGGMVTAVVRGDLRLQEVRIEPSLLAEGDVDMIQDLVMAAVNAALANAQSMVQSAMQQASNPLAMLFGNQA